MNWLIYSSENNQYTVKIRTRVVEEVLNECKKSLNIETGGILIGTYTDDLLCALINSICKAPKDSKKTRTMFKRGVYGLLSFLDKKWEETGEYYLGEWHYHPNSLPQPSRKDISQMKKLSRKKKLNCPEPILIIVGGGENKGWEISVHIFRKKDKIKLYRER